MIILKSVGAVVFGVLLLSSAQAQTAAQELVDKLADLTSLTGNFEQTLIDEAGEVIESSSGQFVLQKPGRFYWLTTRPYEQQLVSNGETIWLYDPDLFQVTVRQVTADLEKSPALLLSADADQLSTNYDVAAAQDDGFTLTPRQPQALFDSLYLGFAGGQIQTVRLNDALGQATVIAFTDTQANVPVDESRFHFVVPDDVDVLID
ncbi:outer membrane lipoprotein chaperone LolA [Gilvimarinus sp. SDUM040013]|uniref:Outer-membrane lipoprotein carrier protein n=1 Tax=Gilvimarinus gilvus TaxID=3058038 RepID=A0ABU4S044_9GAMM|nr:outer membrane lipoprotein chaperone LolA [Gilvimarinus sp. SDUM040013]MDO3388772.1 outer membrane lipoprotein chaperone LolA [Gilvimarinus sp. SDUM040013]MDX6850525.1 outer membrane lipoprotein chaperone LolA [Gilvimarinus sp. SDUM040013]